MNEDRVVIEIEDENGNTLELSEVAQLQINDPESGNLEDLILFSHEEDDDSSDLYLFRIIDDETLEPVKDSALIEAALAAFEDETDEVE